MSKYPVTILLILLIALQTFSKWCLIAEYQINKDYIAKNLCINRARPCCHCHGKCYLAKKLAADESQQQAPGKGAQKEESATQLFAYDDLHVIHHPQIILHPGATRYLDRQLQEFTVSIFQPPGM